MWRELNFGVKINLQSKSITYTSLTAMSLCVQRSEQRWHDYLEVPQWTALSAVPTASPLRHTVAGRQVKALAPRLRATASSTHAEGKAFQQTASPEGTGYSERFGTGLSTWTLNERRSWRRNQLWRRSAGLPQTSSIDTFQKDGKRSFDHRQTFKIKQLNQTSRHLKYNNYLRHSFAIIK